MSYREEIIDYTQNKDEIEKWVALKGEQKYLRFIEILKEHNVPITWQNVSELYRYDKRLLINTFKYMSFFEEFLRALVWNVSELSYKRLEDKSLNEVVDKVIELNNRINYAGFSVETLKTNRDYINYLRNHISHNKIILECVKNANSINKILTAFRNTLPNEYQIGFAKDICNCTNGLDLDSELIVKF